MKTDAIEILKTFAEIRGVLYTAMNDRPRALPPELEPHYRTLKVFDASDQPIVAALLTLALAVKGTFDDTE